MVNLIQATKLLLRLFRVQETPISASTANN